MGMGQIVPSMTRDNIQCWEMQVRAPGSEQPEEELEVAKDVGVLVADNLRPYTRRRTRRSLRRLR